MSSLWGESSASEKMKSVNMKFNISQQLKEVESHFSWMNTMVPLLEQTVLTRFSTMESYIQSLNIIKDSVIDDAEEADKAENRENILKSYYNIDYPMYHSLFAKRFNEAAGLACLSEFEAAKKRLEGLEIFYEKLDVYHAMAHMYCVDALRWSIKVLSNSQRKNTNPSFEKADVAESELMEEAVVFRKRWEELRRNNKAAAVFEFLWGNLGEHLKISGDHVMKSFSEVLRLDPGNHIWYTILYRKIRDQRQFTGNLGKPLEYEQFLATEAYKRQPLIYLSIKDMGVMLKDTLSIENIGTWHFEEKTYLRCWGLFDKACFASSAALRIAKERNQRKWISKIQLHMGELLLFGRRNKVNQDEGKRYFEMCLTANPDDPTVLHNIGKLHHYGAAVTGSFRDLQLAEQFYKHSLDLHPGNFPCLKDYLELLHARQKYEKYIQYCDLALSQGYLKRDYQVSDISILRGWVVWIFNPLNSRNNREEALKTWLDIVHKLPNFAENVYDTIKKPPFNWGQNQPACVRMDQFVTALESFNSNGGIFKAENKGNTAAIQTFLTQIQTTKAEQDSKKGEASASSALRGGRNSRRYDTSNE